MCSPPIAQPSPANPFKSWFSIPLRSLHRLLHLSRYVWRVCAQLLSCIWLSVTPGLQPAGFPCPWDFLGQGTGGGCCLLLQWSKEYTVSTIYAKKWGGNQHPNVLNSTIHSSLDTRATKVSIHRWTDKKMWCIHIWIHMDGLGNYHTKGSESKRERQISWDITYLWNLKKIQINLFTKQRQTHRYRKQVYGAKEEEG